jgi:peptidoglycan/xylan/chitin deacetylase (PgdA/CDA1 family)
MIIVDLLRFSFQKKNVLSAFLCWTGLIFFLRKRTLQSNNLIILAYHRVIPEYKVDYEFDDDLISATPEQFDWQVRYIKKNYNLISFEDLAGYRESGTSLPQRSIIITFDDGFDDNYLYAYPILKKHNAKACFFISTDYIGSDDFFWFDWATYLCNQLKQDIILKVKNGKDEIRICVDQERKKMIRSFLSSLKEISNEDRKGAINQLESSVDIDNVNSKLSRAMSWEQVRSMHDSGLVEIGSHTKSHPILSQIKNDELYDELCGSKRAIQNRLSINSCHILSYPVGGVAAYNEVVLKAVKDAGYLYALTYIPGLNIFGETSDYLLKRLHVEKYLKKYRFKAMLELPKYLC